MRNGWDIVDSNLEKTGNENEINRKWIIIFPVFEVTIFKSTSMCGYLFKISDQSIENWPRYKCKNFSIFGDLITH